MKKLKKLITVMCLIGLIGVIPMASFCDANAGRSIPEYTGTCTHCGSTSWSFIQQRSQETRSWMTTCSCSEAVHKHWSVSYYNDYICDNCGIIATKFDHSEVYCIARDVVRDSACSK